MAKLKCGFYGMRNQTKLVLLACDEPDSVSPKDLVIEGDTMAAAGVTVCVASRGPVTSRRRPLHPVLTLTPYCVSHSTFTLLLDSDSNDKLRSGQHAIPMGRQAARQAAPREWTSSFTPRCPEVDRAELAESNFLE